MEERGLARITTEPLHERELTEFVAMSESGGVVLFSGVVRDHHEGRGVLRIEYAAAEKLAEAKLRDLVQETLEVPAVHRAAAVHRIGLLDVGESSVMVAASAAHRAEAFLAARQLIDRIKEVLPVWKKENFDDGTAAWAPGFTVAETDRSPGPEPAREAGGC